MSGKLKVTKEVAKAIEELRGLGRLNSEIIVKMVDGTPLETDGEWALFYYVNGEGEDALISALINGYEVENTPEDDVREYYEMYQQNTRFSVNKRRTIRDTLNLLGITIEGVNG